MTGDTITLSKSEYDTALKVAVQGKQIEIIVDGMKDMTSSINDLGIKIDDIPQTIVDCRDKLETDIKDDIADNYVTHTEMRGYKNKIIGWVAGSSSMLAVFIWFIEHQDKIIN